MDILLFDTYLSDKFATEKGIILSVQAGNLVKEYLQHSGGL